MTFLMEPPRQPNAAKVLPMRRPLINHLLLIVTLGWLVCTTQAAEPAPRGPTPKVYLGKSVANLTFHDFKSLPVERRNSVVAEIARAAPLQSMELELLRTLSNEKLLTEPSVLGPLIESLERNAPKADTDFSQKRANDISIALQILCQLTRRDCGEAVQNQREKRPDKVREVVAWWSQWWAENHDKHPLIDAALETTIAQRVAAIASRLKANLGKDYYELGYLQPKNVRVRFIEPLVEVQVDSSRLSEMFMRRDVNGSEHPVRKDEHTSTRIRVAFRTERLSIPGDSIVAGQEPPKNLIPFVERVFTEEIPGTDLVITVDAAQEKGDFVRRARGSLSKLQSGFTRE